MSKSWKRKKTDLWAMGLRGHTNNTCKASTA
jgi:hypothetical protein